MTVSRRKRKRERALREATARPPFWVPSLGVGGRSPESALKASDLRLIRLAVTCDWNIPKAHRPGLVDAVSAELLVRFPRVATAAARVLLEMTAANSRADAAEGGLGDEECRP